ncbi:MAG TPA: lysylphosphatidylglycerol synthase transmembrane domain-containing protein [Mycobacteriales bacterium]|nr:lysylphosphatidylglycerol synthase transmembrane domain-containing protein [Mycobacteriales bacterium]
MKLHPKANTALRVGFVLVAVALLVYAVASKWGDVRDALSRMGPLPVIGSLALAIIGLFFTCMCWRALMSELGSPLPMVASIRVFFLSQVGKYLPGSVWPFVAQMEMTRDLGIPRERSGTAGLLFLGLNPLTGIIVGAVTLPFVSPHTLREYWWSLLIVPIGLAILHPKVLNPLLRRAFKILKRPALERPLRAYGLAKAAGWLIVTWVFYGLSILVMAAPLGVHGGKALPASIGAYALAWSAGFIFIIAPAGLGVRDAALVLTLSTVMSTPSATAVAAVSRVVQTLGDGGWAMVAGVLHGRAKRRNGPGANATDDSTDGAAESDPDPNPEPDPEPAEPPRTGGRHAR